MSPQSDNGLRAWPEDWPWYKQACFGSWEKRCDMLVGPCSCGAWHVAGEFEWDGVVLKRYDKTVPHMWPPNSEPRRHLYFQQQLEALKRKAETEHAKMMLVAWEKVLGKLL